MPGAIAQAFVEVRPDTEGFGRDLNSRVGGIAKNIGLAIGGAFAASKAVDFLKGSVDAARESNAVAAQSAAVIKSTGGAANVTAGDVDKLANAIARKTGIDDEQIAKASNMLLTFTKIQNQTGKNNDIFNQATKIAVDMGKALGTDASGSAIQLGKALQDPIKGITALTRVGVTFSEGQKDQIKTLVASGRATEAQKVILGELRKEFGGSAEAQATAAGKLSVVFDNLKETLGNKLIPVIDKVAGFLADRLPGALDKAGKFFDKIAVAIRPVIDAIKALVNGDTEGFATQLQKVFGGKVETIRKFGEVILRVADFIKDHLKPILIGLGAAFLIITSPVTAVIAALVLAYVKSQLFRDIIGKVVGVIADLVAFVQKNLPKFQEAFSHVVNVVISIFNQFKGTVLPVIKAVIDTAAKIIGRIVDVIKQIVLFVTNIINGDFSKAFGNLKNIVGDIIGGVIDLLKGLVPSILGLVVGILSAIGSLVTDIVGGFIGGIAGKVGDVIGAVLGFLGGIIGAAIGFITDKVVEIGKAIFVIATFPARVAVVIAQHFDDIVSFFSGLPGRILGFVGDVVKAGVEFGASLLKGIAKGIGAAVDFVADFAKHLFNAIGGFINKNIIDVINNAIPDQLSLGPIHVNLPKNPIPRIPRLAAGGITTEQTLALLGDNRSHREAIIPLDSATARGLLGGGGVTFGPGSIQVTFDGAIPTEAQAFATGQAVGRGIISEQERADARRTRRVA